MGKQQDAAEGGKTSSLRVQPFARPENLKNLVSQAYRKLKDYIPKLRTALSLYIGNKETENILYAPVRVSQLAGLAINAQGIVLEPATCTIVIPRIHTVKSHV